MSAEKIINSENTIINLKTSEVKEKVSSSRVDINHLLARVRKEKQVERKTNIVFFGLFIALLAIVGIFLSF